MRQGPAAGKNPDQPLNCLMVQCAFSPHSFWNFRDAARTMGSYAYTAPLSLITVAALLPQHWKFKLIDENCERLTDEQIAWADIICTGGMLPQQASILELIRRAKALNRHVIVGGPDPTSQPHVYQHADTLVLGEGEISIPLWLESWRAGELGCAIRCCGKDARRSRDSHSAL